MTAARLEARFARCRAEGRAAFVAYLMAGDPDRAGAETFLRGVPGAGADVIELGFPFSDPMAEGPTIQRASLRALEAGTTLAGVLGMVRAFRAGELGIQLPSQVIEAMERKRGPAEPPMRVELGAVRPELAELAEREELRIAGYAHTLDADAVRHILQQHGDPAREARRGQLPVTREDLQDLPNIIQQAGLVALGLRTQGGLPALALVRERPDGTTMAVEAALAGRGRLAVKTVWKWPGGTREARLKAVLGQHVRNAPQVGIKLVSMTSAVKQAGDTETPLILMGYLNPVLSYGYRRFAADAAAAGVDGLLIVDCPPEEADELADALDAHGLALVRLAAPTTDDARLPAVVRRASGFVYYVSVAGVTGVKSAVEGTVGPAVERIRRASGLPVAVGFGIRTPEQAAAVARVADAAVVGSALVDALETGGVEAALREASALAEAVRHARGKDV